MPCVVISCINGRPRTLAVRMGDASYLLEQAMIRGCSLPGCGGNHDCLNHLCLRLHDLRGPFKYEQDRTEYDSTVVNGYARGIAHKFYHFPF